MTSTNPDVRVVQVWDLPLRIFHWSLVIAIAAAYVTAEFGGSEWAHWHGRIGSFVLALLVFRVVWGFIGTQHARFGNFLPTPARVAAYLSGRWQRAGHNPLGALSVIALLLLVAAQVITGLFANDDIAFAGPLSSWVGTSASDWLTGWHQQIFYLLASCIGLHILAILFYLLIRKSNLVSPMITGKKAVVTSHPSAAPRHLAWRFVAAVFVAATVAWPTFRDSSSVHAETVAPPVATADW
jgi:cytochrome b